MYIYDHLYRERGVYLPKVPLNITVDKEVLERFKDLCENNDIKISTKVNTLMKEWVELQKDKE